jgi:hypothetical protein
MTSALTRRLLLGAALLGGLLAGGNLDRAIVQNTAWRELGASAWATYSRHADLSPRGFAYFPFLGIGGALLSIAAAVSFRQGWNTFRAEAIPVYAGALLTVGGLLATSQAAPIMLSVRGLGDDPASLQHAMEGFTSWGGIRGLLQERAFLANLWALTVSTVGQRRDRIDGHRVAP